MQKVSVSFHFFFHFNNNVQRCFKIIEVVTDVFVLVAKRLELHLIGQAGLSNPKPPTGMPLHLQLSFLVPKSDFLMAPTYPPLLPNTQGSRAQELLASLSVSPNPIQTYTFNVSLQEGTITRMPRCFNQLNPVKVNNQSHLVLLSLNTLCPR